MTRMFRRTAVIAAVVSVIGLVPASAGGGGKSYQAPFKVGAGGGDQFSYHSATSDGSITVGRAYPFPGAINCTKGGPFARLFVVHHATHAVHKVTVSYDSAAVDNFTFAMLALRDKKGHWYGTKTVRGFIQGSGTISFKPDQPQGRFPRDLIVDFGLQQSSACPNVDVGTIKFTKVEVS